MGCFHIQSEWDVFVFSQNGLSLYSVRMGCLCSQNPVVIYWVIMGCLCIQSELDVFVFSQNGLSLYSVRMVCPLLSQHGMSSQSVRIGCLCIQSEWNVFVFSQNGLSLYSVRMVCPLLSQDGMSSQSVRMGCLCILHATRMGLCLSGLEPGSVIITDEAVDGLLRPYMEIVCRGLELFFHYYFLEHLTFGTFLT